MTAEFVEDPLDRILHPVLVFFLLFVHVAPVPGNVFRYVLCHTGADKPWVERLAERIEAEPYQNRFLGVVFDKWDFEKGGNIVVDIEKEIDACRYVGVVVTRAMLGAEWPTMERSIAVWSDPACCRLRRRCIRPKTATEARSR